MTRRSKTPMPHSRKHKKLARSFPKRVVVAAAAPPPGDPRPWGHGRYKRRAAAALRNSTAFHPSAEGRTHVKVAPESAFADAERRPPCASTIERLIRSPIPMLFGLVE